MKSFHPTTGLYSEINKYLFVHLQVHLTIYYLTLLRHPVTDTKAVDISQYPHTEGKSPPGEMSKMY